MVLHALDVIGREAGPGNVEITSDFVGVVPSSYPVDLIHLFTSGPQEAIIQVALKPDAPRGEALRERLRESLAPRTARQHDLIRSRRHRQPGDELRIAHAHRGRGAGHQPRGRLRLRAEDPGADGQPGLPARSPVRAGEQLSDARHRDRPRPRRPVRPDHGGRGALGGARHFVLALHRPQLLARSEFRQRLPDPGRDPAKPDAERRAGGRHPGNARWQPAAAPHRHRQPQAGHHARTHRTLQRPARRQPHRQHPWADAGRSGAADRSRGGRGRRASARRHRTDAGRDPAARTDAFPACARACCWRCWRSFCCCRPTSNPCAWP